MELNIKTCCTCNKRFVVEKGFYQRSDGTYYTECKSCHNERTSINASKLLEGKRIKHKWDTELGIGKCIRCGLKRHKSAHMTFVGRYVYKYLINNQWEKNLPSCDSLGL